MGDGGVSGMQQHLLGLLAAASSAAVPLPEDAARAEVLASLHQALLLPQTGPVLRRISANLFQGLQQLLSDKTYVVRHAAGIAFGTLCALAVSGVPPTNGRPSIVVPGSPADRFMGWALPQLTQPGLDTDSIVVALDSTREFLSASETWAAEYFVPSIIQACQVLLEDERTSMMLQPILGLLTIVGMKFNHFLQPHFPDIMDLLLGWALEADLPDEDQRLIIDCFFQFQKLWSANISFSVNLLSKFLGDMEVLAHDSALGAPRQFRRLLALVACFMTVLQATFLGNAHQNYFIDSVRKMLPRLVSCFANIGRTFRNFKWISRATQCLVLVAEMLKGSFAAHYFSVLDILLKRLATDRASVTYQQGIGTLPPSPCSAPLSSTQVCTLLQMNLQMIAAQGSWLFPSAALKLLETGSVFSNLRLHPSQLVTGAVAATYISFLRHASDNVESEASLHLKREMEAFSANLLQKSVYQDQKENGKLATDLFSESELVALLKFDLMALLVSALLNAGNSGSNENARKSKTSQILRAKEIKKFIMERFNPFRVPIQWYADLQLAAIQALRRVYSWILPQAGDIDDSSTILDCISECNLTMAQALHSHSSLPVKLESLEWIGDVADYYASARHLEDIVPLSNSLVYMLVSAASDKEPNVREHVARIIELLLRAKLFSPSQLHAVASAALEQLADPEPGLQAAYLKLLAASASAALWVHGWNMDAEAKPGNELSAGSSLVVANHQQNWRYMFSVKTVTPQLRPQHVVCIFNYVSQRGQVLPLDWLQRMVFNCLRFGTEKAPEDNISKQVDAAEKRDEISIFDGAGSIGMIERWCSSSNLAALWCLIQEAARHCITVRFRTHLGGPTQTFAALERMLLDIPQLAQTDSGQRDSNSGVNFSGVQLIPMRLLLELVESLQKNIYNAYEGSVVLAPPASPSVVFFRANKKVCEEWFARIREALMNASSAIHGHFATAHHAMHRLQDLRPMALTAVREMPRTQAPDTGLSLKGKLQQDIFRVLRQCSLALCRIHESDSLLGLQAWAASAFGALLLEDGLPVQKASSAFGPLGWMNGLALQARGEYERATAHYMHLLQSEETMAAIGADGVQFTIARIIESYVALSDWDAFDSWLQDLQCLRAKHAGKSYAGALTTAGNDMNSIHALARFDAGDVQGAWGYLDLTPQSSSELTIDPRQALQRSEQMLLQAMLRKDDKHEDAAREIKLAKTMLDEPLLVSVFDGISDAAAYLTQLNCIGVVESWAGLTEQPKVFHDALAQVVWYPADEMYQDCQLWLRVLRVYRMAFPKSDITFQLHEQLIRLARKHNNFRLALRLLKQMEGTRLSEMVLYESSLLLFSEGQHQKAIVELWPLVQSYILGSPQAVLSGDVDMVKAKVCLKLASWLQKKLPEEPSMSLLSEMQLDRVDGFRSEAQPILTFQEVIGAGNKAATLFCPSMGKAWFSYASWCYSCARGSFFGKEMISKPQLFPQVLDAEFVSSSSSLTQKELEVVRDLITDAVGGEIPLDFEGVTRDQSTITEMLVARVTHLMEAAAGASGFEEWDGESPVVRLTLQLRQELQMLKSSSVSNLLLELVHVWLAVRRRRVSLFGHAAHGFLKYLSMSTKTSVGKCTVNPLKGDCTLSASLFVLHILQNYGVELEDILQRGLSSVPPSPWQEITPQLFACLSSHPEPRVRKQLEGIVLVLANVYPWAIVYPTLVDLSASEGQSSEELEHILSSLVKLHPKLVDDVRLMIAELGSITFLWEEQWLTTLQDLHADVTRRIITLKEEAARVAENQTLSHEEKTRINAAKYSAIMAPIIVSLERRLTLTSKPPETPHEAWFQEHFGSQLRSAITTFKVPPTGFNALNDAWKAFDVIATSLANHHKRSAVLLKDVSPRLAALKHCDAPMPGLEVHTVLPEDSKSMGVVTVAGFNEQITILATKTKPKKVSVMGSDGKRYTYLLKGREDLRLDARIMQLLRASNKMLHTSSVTRHQGLAIRCYSVTPISGRAGLIQWVDNVTSLYSVYKAWQQRAQAAQLFSNNVAGVPPPVPRPSDMFYGKIIPALKEKGSRKVISRRDWPQDVKRKVLLDLMKETPRQLLYRELWCASDGLNGFNTKIKRFSGSVAVMSMIGHVLGLGDRHLDNILIDFSSGDVVHIDYNVCFDKGLRLKVPEIVPFRLTQTIQAALGLTGVEGVFRTNCEAVLSTLQKNKDLILMLLEAFIWDPLVEWMRGDGHDEATIGGEERKGMEIAVSLSLFASHVQENRVPLQEHHDQLLSTLPVAVSTLQEWATEYEKFEKCSTLTSDINQRKYNAEKAEVAARGLSTEASCALDKAHLAYEMQAREFAQAKELIAEAARESAQWIEQRSRVLDLLRSGTAPELQAMVQLSNSVEALSLIPAVLAAGVALTVLPEPTQIHCKEIDWEVSQFTTARHEALLHAGRTLHAYSLALQRLLPGNYVTTSYVHSWAHILQLCSRQVSPEALSLAKRQAMEIIARGRGEHDNAICQKHEKLRMHAERLNEEVQKLEKDRSELEASVDPDAERKAKDRLMGIFIRNLQIGKKDEDDSKEKEMTSFDLEERRIKVMTVLQSAVAIIYKEIGEKVAGLQNFAVERSIFGSLDDLQVQRWCFPEFQELAERCVLVSDVLNEVQQLSEKVGVHRTSLWDSSSSLSERVLSVTDCLAGIYHLVKQMVGVVLPEAIKAALSYDPAVMEAFASLSQIRGAIDTTLEQVAEIEMQKSALLELEKSYPDKVEEISKRQAQLEAAAAGGRDQLSWEEAEEVASEEEFLREQLDKLHRDWAQRGAQASAVLRMEGLIRAALATAEQRFEALVALDRDDLHLMRGKVLLAAFAKLFSELESLDSALKHGPLETNRKPIQSDNLLSPGLEYIWKASSILQEKTFFVWKVCVMDVLLDSCVRDASSDLTLSLDQLISQQKRRLEAQLQGLLDLYLRIQVAPEFLDLILKETIILKPVTSNTDDVQHLKKEGEPVRKAVKLLREYCDVHETVRAARSAASALKVQADEAKQSFQNAQIEIAQLEWLDDSALSHLQPQAQTLGIPGAFGSENMTNIAWWNRKQILENVRNSIAAISRATEGLQKCELASMSAEEQLERTMAWACAGHNTSASGTNSANRSAGIPQEFQEHLRRRQQLLWSGQEQATGIVRLCVVVLEFEASREGFLDSQAGRSTTSTSSDGKAWQQTYQNLILRLEATYLTFTSCDLEWKSAQKTLEAANANLSNVLNELHLVSAESEAAAGELRTGVFQLKQHTIEAATAVSSFCKVLRTHTALTSEGVLMLDEVLALTEGAEGASDVHTLAKEAIAERKRLISDLKKVHAMMSPLEPMLSSAASIMNADLDLKTAGKSHTTILQSLDMKLKESLAELPMIVTSVLSAVQKLHLALSNLARAASVDAVTLNKAFEGMEESQTNRAQEDTISAPSEDVLPSEDHVESVADPLSEEDLWRDDDSWISPPGTNSGDSEYSLLDLPSTQDQNDLEVVISELAQSQFEEAFVNSLSAEATRSQSKSTKEKPGVSQPSLQHAESSFTFADADKLQSGEARSGNDQKQPSSKAGSSSNVLSFLHSSNVDHHSRVVRGNAVYVLKRVRTKLEGRDIDDTGQLSIAEQVDHLLRQATSIDNLCNMYEGWTPWI